MRKIFILGIMTLIITGCNPAKESSSSQVGEKSAVAQPQKASLQQGIDYLAKGQVNEAIQSFQNVAAQDPQNTEALFAIGQVYMKVGSFDNAISAGQEILKRDPQNGDAYMMIAGCYDMKGEASQAIDIVKVAAAIYQQKNDTQGFQRAVGILQKLTENAPAPTE